MWERKCVCLLPFQLCLHTIRAVSSHYASISAHLLWLALSNTWFNDVCVSESCCALFVTLLLCCGALSYCVVELCCIWCCCVVLCCILLYFVVFVLFFLCCFVVCVHAQNIRTFDSPSQ